MESLPADQAVPAATVLASTPHAPGMERPGDLIGPYKLLAVLGEGGFGTVWLAERREPFVQRVALKIIKPGMDSRAVVARFEQERQALAVMDHPNVAKVLDGGITPHGRPYFVMEHVKGEPITTFCDRHRLTIRQRLELFIPVCEAVQHAHMKGIIHRDLKPSNILVGMVDTGATGAPRAPDPHPTSDIAHPTSQGAVNGALVKVIDFGVAKAISHTLTDKTIFTEQGMIIGTPEYMSPEQAEMGAVDIDTRTDVYSLGAVLYELLTGVLPFEPAQLRGLGFGDIQKMIRESPPTRPSTRITTLGPGAAPLAQARSTSAGDLARQLKSAVEWLPLMALRKDRTQRYHTAAELAADIRRYLRGEPLVAGPLSLAYRVRTLMWMHRTLVTAAAVCALVLVAAATHGYVSARSEARARARADQAVRDLSAVATMTFDHAADLYRKALDRAIRTSVDAGAPIVDGYGQQLDLIRALYSDLVAAHRLKKPEFVPSEFVRDLWNDPSPRAREGLQCIIAAARVLDALTVVESLPRAVYSDPTYTVPRQSLASLGFGAGSTPHAALDVGAGRRQFISELRPPELPYEQWAEVIRLVWGSAGT